MIKFSQILVPVSGLAIEDQAIRLACEIARRDKAKVLAVNVMEIERALPLDVEQDAQIQRAEQILDHAQKTAKVVGVAIETDLLQSRVAGPALVDEANERRVDLIVVGLPFRKRLDAFHMGATTTYILKNAASAVWLCREAAPADKKPGAEGI
jgi:nucleotide-binding universal stress UspA family protein